MRKEAEEFLAHLSRVDKDTPPIVLAELFNFIRIYWETIGPELDIAEKVCAKLSISRGIFNLWLENPTMIFGTESLYRQLKPDSWLRRYLEYTAGHEAPEDFHLWVGLTVLGAALRRNIWFDNVFYRLYPNLYTVLISPPAVCKKSTCIDIGIRLLRTAETDVVIISEKITPEAIFVALAKSKIEKKESEGVVIRKAAHGLFNAPELTVFLGREAYNESLIILLTRLYDCPDFLDSATKGKGVLELKNVFTSMLGATTPSEISKAIPESATGGGFVSRVTFVSRDISTRSFPFPIMADPTIKDLLAAQLAKIAREVSGGFVFSDTGREWYRDYYNKHKADLHKKGPATERQPDLIIKVAMILTISEGATGDSPLLLEPDTLERAQNIMSSVEKGIEGTLKMISASEYGRLAELVLTQIRKNGGTIKHTMLLKKLYRKMSGREINACIDTLRESEVIEKTKGEGGTWYRLRSLDT